MAEQNGEQLRKAQKALRECHEAWSLMKDERDQAKAERDDLSETLKKLAQPGGACAKGRGACRGGVRASEIARQALRGRLDG